jgi:hypothetical protein
MNGDNFSCSRIVNITLMTLISDVLLSTSLDKSKLVIVVPSKHANN